MLLWELFSPGDIPYYAKTNDELLIEAVIGGLRLPRPEGCPESLFAVALECWCVEPARRPSIEALNEKLQHERWLADKQQIEQGLALE